MKRIVTIMLVLLGSMTYGQVTVTTTELNICYWDSIAEEFSIDCRVNKEYVSKYVVNENSTIITHTTANMTSTYYVDEIERDLDNGRKLFGYFVTSDVGNEYLMWFDFKYNEVRTVPLSGEYILMTIIKGVY